MMVFKNTLLDIMKDTGFLNEEQYKNVLKTKNETNQNLIDILEEIGISDKSNLYIQFKNLLELQYGVDFLSLPQTLINDDLIELFNQDLIVEHKFLPIKKLNDIYTFAMVDPNNILAEREIKYALKNFENAKLKKVVILEDDFAKFVDNKFNLSSKQEAIIEEDTDELITSMGIDLIENASDDIDVADLADSAADAPIIQLANSILGVAIKRGISDIHIEPREKELRVRYRLDGVLSVYKTFPKKIQNAIISRYKIMAELDISERRLPQDGRIRVKMTDKFIDFRVSSLPSKFGEKIVMRILDKSNVSLGLDNLITNKETLKIIREMINRPFGIIFVTGPTGSGKTTTLYSALSERNTPDVNISTAEDPIEYDLEGITQSEVNKNIGMDFAKILKAFLRQDPDIMLVGETRDKETAKIAVEAALTGHLVFTTLHTNDAPGSVMRLREMEVEPFLISSSTIGIVAQRLLRRLCPDCKKKYTPDAEMIKFLSLEHYENKEFYLPVGCEKCNHSGYKGRVGAYEVMKINDEIRDLIAKGVNTAVLRLAAQEAGMKTLLEYSINLAQEGHTSLDEVIRVTFSGESGAAICPNCGKPVDEEYMRCPFCQEELKKTCPRCKVLIDDTWSSCANCGLSLNNGRANTNCKICGGEISLDMDSCPWCYNKI